MTGILLPGGVTLYGEGSPDPGLCGAAFGEGVALPGGVTLWAKSPCSETPEVLNDAVVLFRASSVDVSSWEAGDPIVNEGTLHGAAVSTPIVGAETTGPILMDPADGGYQAVHVSTNSTTSFSTPNSPAIAVAGDLDLRANYGTFGDPTAGNAENRVAGIARITGLNSGVAGFDDLSYEHSIGVGGGPVPTIPGAPILIWVDSSDVQHVASTDAGLDPYVLNELFYYLDVDNGAGGWTAYFYLRDDTEPDLTTDDGKGWRLLGTDTGSGVTDIRNTNGPLTAMSFRAKGTYAEVRDGFDGTLVASFYADDAAGWAIPTGTFVSSETGETWTVQSASTVAPVQRPAWLMGFDEIGVAQNASFSLADENGIDVGTSDWSLAFLMNPSRVITTNNTSVTFASKATGTIGQGGVGWAVQDLRFDGFGLDGFGALSSDGTDGATSISNTGWSAARHLVVVNMDRDGNQTTYVDGTARGTAAMSAVDSIANAANMVLGSSSTAFFWLLEDHAEWSRILTATEITTDLPAALNT